MLINLLTRTVGFVQDYIYALLVMALFSTRMYTVFILFILYSIFISENKRYDIGLHRITSVLPEPRLVQNYNKYGERVSLQMKECFSVK